MNEIVRSEDSAEQRTVTGWVCKRCSRYWGDDEHMARYCCATDFPCECGGRRSKPYTHCKSCREKHEYERWFAKEPIEWDGEFPVALWDDDRFFFDADELGFYLEEYELELEYLWLTTCEPNNGRHFEMSEYLCDELPEEFDLDDKEINETVNKWISGHAPFSFYVTGKRLSIESVKRKLNHPVA